MLEADTAQHPSHTNVCLVNALDPSLDARQKAAAQLSTCGSPVLVSAAVSQRRSEGHRSRLIARNSSKMLDPCVPTVQPGYLTYEHLELVPGQGSYRA